MATYFVQNTNSVEDIEQMNNVIDKINKVNTEATSNIGQLTDLNNKAQELSNNIQEALPINTELKENIKIGQPLVQEAVSKNTELQASLEKTKEFIDGLDGSQNIPQIRLDVTELQNGLKSNQALAYKRSSITANDTLEGRTEGMRIGGRTLKNLLGRTYSNYYSLITDIKPNTIYTVIKFNNRNRRVGIFKDNSSIAPIEEYTDRMVFSFNSGTMDDYKSLRFYQDANMGGVIEDDKNIIILEGDYTKTNNCIPNYFEGLKSFGEAEKEGDKYKISILSCGKNLLKPPSEEKIIPLAPNSPKVTITTDGKYILNGNSSITGGRHSFKDLIPKVLLRKGKTYKLSGDNTSNTTLWMNKYDDNSAVLSNKGDSYTPTVDTLVYFGINYTVTTYNSYEILPQLEEDTVTSYEPYKEDRKDILIKEPLRGFNENTCDVMYEDNGQVKINRNIDTYTFTGDEGWTLGTQSSGWDEFDDTLVFYLDPFKAKTNTRFICDKFAYKNVVNINEVGIYNNVWGNKPHPVIRIKKSELSTPDLEGFKSWLKTNPTTMIYQLAEPTIEIVENCVDIDLDTYQEKTYFNILNSLPGTLDFKVPSNIGSSLQNLAKEVNNIWDVINNMILPGMVDIVDKTVQASLKLVSK